MLELNTEPKSSTGEIPLLPGERIDPDINGREVVYICPYAGEISGQLYFTNYKLKIDKYGGSRSKADNSYGITLTCKDIRTLRFAHNPENHSRRDVFDKLKQYAFPPQSFADEATMQYSVSNGWSIYEPLMEFRRMKVPNETWRITRINDKYKLCDTYPAILAVPQAATDEELQSVASFRSRGRLPVLSWLHPESQASITRCSQPMTGISGHRSSDDEKYIQLIMDANAQSHKIYIMDARPQTNALANKTRGGGLENEHLYNAEIQFLGISSIHVMRESLRKLTDLCFPGNTEDGGARFYEELEATQWLAHIRLILSGAVRVVDKIEYQKTSVVVHCSDGWDRTAQLTSLSMIMLDQYYRTLTGFEVLIEKEWLSFGHKFAQRIGHCEDKPNDDNRSPVFLQWLDCVWQLTKQFPTAFDSGGMRGLTSKTRSLWSMVNSFKHEFLNPLYSASPSHSMISVTSAQARDYVIIPRCSAPFIQLWTSYFCRWNLNISPNSVEQVRTRNKELLAMRAEIEKRVEELQKQLQSKYSKVGSQSSSSASNTQNTSSPTSPSNQPLQQSVSNPSNRVPVQL
ncbi:Myotubularin- protein 2 [Tyrophagus putrescentiae]|nr:Myotubularin- protein 2 [Tyrophagus putrescentiae]